MAKAKFKYEKAKGTPAGRAFFPAFNTPDVYEGVAKYKGGVILDPEIPTDAKFISDMETLLETRVAQYLNGETGDGSGVKFKDAHDINDLFTYQTDKDGEPTGKLIFQCNSKDHPTFEDSQGTKLKGNLPTISGGDIIRMAFQCVFYAMPGAPIKVKGKPPVKTVRVGLAKYLKAVRLIEAQGSGGYGEAFGGAEEGEGYVHDSSAFDDEDSSPANDSQDF